MFKNIVFFALGAIVMRQIMISQSREAYLQKEAETLDRIQNKMHDFMKDKFPQLSDVEIGDLVMDITEGGEYDIAA